MVSIPITFLAFGLITTLLFLSLPEKNNITSLWHVVQGSYVDEDVKCPDLSGQYEIILLDYNKSNPESVKSLDEVVNKINSSGIEIINVLDNLGVITIKSSDEQLINNLKEEFINDKQIKIEQSICQRMFNP